MEPIKLSDRAKHIAVIGAYHNDIVVIVRNRRCQRSVFQLEAFNKGRTNPTVFAVAFYNRQFKNIPLRVSLNTAIADILKDYAEPVPGARRRVENALQVMLTAWVAARMRQQAENMLQKLEQE